MFHRNKTIVLLKLKQIKFKKIKTKQYNFRRETFEIYYVEIKKD